MFNFRNIVSTIDNLLNSFGVKTDSDITIGSFVCGIHMHVPTSGICTDWTVGALSEISEKEFLDRVKSFSKKDMELKPIPNKEAICVEKNISPNGLISSIVVIYKYGSSYYVSKLISR